jgi:hypothetical protein
MKRITVLALALLTPVVMFAQVPPDRGALALKRMGMSDDQVTKITAIVKTAETKVKDDKIHIGLIKARIKDAIMPSTAALDMAAIDKLVDQEAQVRADMEKTVLSAEVELIKIMGRDDFESYSRMIRAELGMGSTMSMQDFRGMQMWARFHGSMMSGAAPYAWRKGAQPPAGQGGQGPAPSGPSN